MTWIHPPPPTVWGPDSIDDLAAYLDARDLGNVLVVTDEGVVEAGVVDRVCKPLSTGYRVFDEVSPNPSRATVDRVNAACDGVDAVIAVGGGSVMDAAKAATALDTVGTAEDPLDDLREWPTHRPVPDPDSKCRLVLVPTTAGTGSETGHWAVISDKNQNRKQSVGHPIMTADLAVLDPELTTSLPPYLTAASGFDVVAHALEALVADGATLLTQPAAREAFEHAVIALPRAVEDGSNVGTRSTMLAASYLAGWSMNNAGLGAVHGISHAIGGLYDTPHGHTNALLLPAVIRHNAQGSDRAASTYADLVDSRTAPGETLASRLVRLRDTVDLDHDLPGLPPNPDWETVAALALDNVNMRSNPVELSVDEVIRICERAFE